MSLFSRIVKHFSKKTINNNDNVNKPNKFACDSFKILSSNSTQQCSFSPTNISYAMNILNFGIPQETQSSVEMCKYFNNDTESCEKLNILNTDKQDYQVAINNGIYIKENFPIKQAFVELAGKYADVKSFNNIQKVVYDVNTLVNEKTFGKVTEILTEDDITEDTKLIILSTLYFKAKWENVMVKDYYNSKFTQVDNSIVKLPFMKSDDEEYCNYHEDNNVQCVEKKYVDNAVMGFILPKNNNAYLNLDNIDNYSKNMKRTFVNIYMPIFKVEQKIDMVGVMQEMGINRIFSAETAKLLNIVDSDDLFVDNIIHAVSIDVGLTGTEAAAVTVVTCTQESCCMAPESIDVILNKSFVWYIRDIKTNAILFCGLYDGC